MRPTRQAMTRLVAILVTLFMVAIPAKADVALSPPVQGWTVIQVYGVIKAGDLATFQRYTENVDPAATLVIVTRPGRQPLGWYRHGYTRSPEEADRGRKGNVRLVVRPAMDGWRNRA